MVASDALCTSATETLPSADTPTKLVLTATPPPSAKLTTLASLIAFTLTPAAPLGSALLLIVIVASFSAARTLCLLSLAPILVLATAPPTVAAAELVLTAIAKEPATVTTSESSSAFTTILLVLAIVLLMVISLSLASLPVYFSTTASVLLLP